MAQLFTSAIGLGEASHCNVKDIKHSQPPYYIFAIIIPMRGDDQKHQGGQAAGGEGSFQSCFKP